VDRVVGKCVDVDFVAEFSGEKEDWGGELVEECAVRG
jgi:hypothetical protein